MDIQAKEVDCSMKYEQLQIQAVRAIYILLFDIFFGQVYFSEKTLPYKIIWLFKI